MTALRLFGRNPLGRMQTALVVLVVVGAAACATVLGTLIYRVETHGYRDQLHTRHEVVATAVDDSKASVSADKTAFTVSARRAANGFNHTGAIGWDDAVQAGDRLQIWVDDNGNPVARPTPPELAGPEAVLAASPHGSSWFWPPFQCWHLCGPTRVISERPSETETFALSLRTAAGVLTPRNGAQNVANGA